MKKKSRPLLLVSGRRLRRSEALLITTIVAVMGIVAVVVIFAAVSPNAFEAESGVVVSPAAKIISSMASGGSVLKFGSSPTGTRPSGPGIIPYESLVAHGSLSATANSLTPAAQLSFLPGTFQFSNFSDANGTDGILFWHTVLGLRGSGVNSTIFQMTPNSSTKASSVPPQSTYPTGTNQLDLMRIEQSPELSDFTLLGTNQGHLYNGLIFFQTTNAVITNVRIKGIPGDNRANPGETFSLNLYRNTDTVLNNLEIDGTNSAGQQVGASGVGINFGSNTVFNNLYVHDMHYGAGVASYTTTNVTFNSPRLINNHRALNFERVDGTVNINKPYFRNSVDSDISIANDQKSGTFNIYDPDFSGPKLTVQVIGYAGNPRTQDPNAVKLYVGGVLRQDLMQLTISN